MGELETLQKIIDNRLSISRYGDGEAKIARGAPIKSQPYCPELARRLRDILWYYRPELLVGIPNIWPLPRLPHDKAKFWTAWKNDRLTGLLNPELVYASAFITRPDSAPSIGGPDYWDLMQSIWKGRPALLITGSGKGRRFLPMLSNAASTALQEAPRQGAWAQYADLLRNALGWFDLNPNGAAILSLGPTATVLAHDLAVRGAQALDLGHSACFWAKTSPKDLVDED